MLADVCPNVGIELLLQTFPMLITRHATAITDDNVRLDVRVNDFWGSNHHQRTYLDVKVLALVLHHVAIHGPRPATSNMKGKKRAYEQRVNETEHGFITPLGFSTSEGMGKAAIVSYRRLASKSVDKGNQPYSLCIQWLRCQLNFHGSGPP